MNKEEIKSEIIDIIMDSEGYITADEIYQRLTENVDPGRTQETIRGYIREIVNSQAHLIGSSNQGYFHITSEDLLKEATSYLLSRVKDLQDRAQNLRNMWEASQGNEGN